MNKVLSNTRTAKAIIKIKLILETAFQFYLNHQDFILGIRQGYSEIKQTQEEFIVLKETITSIIKT